MELGYSFMLKKQNKNRKAHNQASTKDSCNNSLAKYLKGGNSVFGNDLVSQTSVIYCKVFAFKHKKQNKISSFVELRSENKFHHADAVLTEMMLLREHRALNEKECWTEVITITI